MKKSGSPSKLNIPCSIFDIQVLDQMIDAPDGIKRLRELILQLAVQGKLVEQREEEGSADKLLKQIKSNRLSKKELGDTSFEIPPSWAWSNLKSISIFGPKNGYSPKAVDYPTQTKSLTLSATTSGVFLGEHCKYIDETIESDSVLWLEDGDVLFQRGNTKEYVGVSAVYHGEPHSFIYPDLMMKVRFHPKLDIGYLHSACLSGSARDYLRNRASGTSGTMPKINQRTLNSLPIPIPPLAEQKRIVAKVDELMAWCDELDALKQKRDTLQRAALKSSLRELCNAEAQGRGEVEPKKTSAPPRLCVKKSPSQEPQLPSAPPRLCVKNILPLIRDPADVKPLRDAILQLAVQGRLVEQRPEDGTADDLLKQIKEAKRRDTEARKARGERIRKTKILPPIKKDEIPFDIPKNWKWLRVGETGQIFNGNSVNKNKKIELSRSGKGLPFIATKDVGYGRAKLIYDNGVTIPFDEPKFKVAHSHAVLICSEGGSAGKKIGITEQDIYFGNKLYANETWQGIEPRFVFSVYLAPYFYEKFADKMTGIIGGIARSSFVEIPFPLPPLAEQQRIVKKVDELMAYCDEIETLLQTQSATATRFAAAIAKQGGRRLEQ